MNTKNLAYWYLLIGAIYGLTERTIDIAKQGLNTEAKNLTNIIQNYS